MQFFTALEASLLFPLGPLLARDLHFPVVHLGYLNAAFLTSACIAGLMGAILFDSVDRRTAITVALGGLGISTGLIALVGDLPQIMAARLVAGAFGGPAMALSLALVADIVPFERRGRALAAVSRGSAVALVLGVPLSLMLSELAGWRAAIALIGVVGMALMAGAWLLLPSSRPAATRPGHAGVLIGDFMRLAMRPATAAALAMQAINMAIMLVMAVNLAPFFVGNLGYPEHDLKILWAVGGLFVIVGSQLSGGVADRWGAVPAMWLAVSAAGIVYYLMFVLADAGLPLMITFCAFNAATSGRMVAMNLILSHVPAPEERGRFFSLASATGQAAAAIGVIAVGAWLVVAPGGRLIHMDGAAWAAIGGSAIVALLGTVLMQGREAGDGGGATPAVSEG